MKIVIDKDTEITKLENMLETLTDDKDKQSVRFAINIINGFEDRPTGEWIEKENSWGDFYYTCSVCGEDWTTVDVNPNDNLMNYCPVCGAKMKGGEEE